MPSPLRYLLRLRETANRNSVWEREVGGVSRPAAAFGCQNTGKMDTCDEMQSLAPRRSGTNSRRGRHSRSLRRDRLGQHLERRSAMDYASYLPASPRGACTMSATALP